MLLLLLLLIPVLGMVAFAIDAGMMVVLRAEVQNAVDAGALAAALTLQDDPGALDEADVTDAENCDFHGVGGGEIERVG